MRKLLGWTTVFWGVSSPVWAENPKIEFGAFVDAFYAYDFNEPASRERLYTINPARHNEFNIGLAYLEAKVSADRLRGRLALQTGTSVFANYSGEVRDPSKPGGAQLADVLMNLQEAFAGYRIAEGLWLDAGIYLSHIGGESFISKDNWTYTRSLVADFSPYYQTGVKLTWDPGSAWAFQLHLLNGWQNILETNGDKAIGTQITYRASERLTFTHNALVGREAEFRIFQDLVIKYQVSPAWETLLAIDFGLQRRAGGGSFGNWWGASLLNRLRLSERMHLATRLEIYRDPEKFIVATGTPNGFQVWGVSANVDVQLLPQLLWRNELRFLNSLDAVYPSDTGLNPSTLFGVTSLALSL